MVQLVNTADAFRYQPKIANPTAGSSPDVNTTQWRRVGGDRNAWLGGFFEELLDPTNVSYRFCEFNNVVIILDGERDPAYHQRTISGRPAFTADYQHDLVQASSGAASESRFDVFKGAEGKEQIWRGLDAATGKPFILQPGYRNDGVNVVGRPTTVPFIAGATWTVRRTGGEFRTVHKGGKVLPLPHDQTEELGVITALTVDLADYGHTLILGSTAACTVTMPTIANMPDGYWVRLILTGSGSVSAISGVTGINTLATNGTLTIRKTVAGYKGFSA